MAEKNWAGNLVYSADNLHHPQSIEQIRELVRKSKKIKMLGSRHSFNTISDTSDTLISLNNLNRIVELDPKNQTVTIEAGMRYGELATYLHREGFALHNLASLPHISVVGACATGTHGSGMKNGNLATAISEIELIKANNDIVTLSHEDDNFNGAIVNLGALGIVTKITLDIQPTFDVRQNVYLDLPFAHVEQHFDAIMSSAYSVSLFTDWQGDSITQVWLKSIGDDEVSPEFYGAKSATHNYHPIADVSPENSTQQMGISGVWHERLPHFRMEFTPSKGEELQSEYFVSRENTVEAIKRIREIAGLLAPLLLVSEIRCIAADALWMSPCYQDNCVAFHFTWKQDWKALKQILPHLEAALAPFLPRPHWGKVFTMSAEQINLRYKKLPDFKNLAQTYDPNGKFRNDFLNQYIFA